MRTTLVAVLSAAAMLSASAEERPGLYRLSYGRPGGPGSNVYVMNLGGTSFSTRHAFTASVASLPAGSRLVWDSGCIPFSEIPLGPEPRLSIAGFKEFCRQHRIRFEYHCGLRETLRTQVFAAPSALFSSRPKELLEAQGVTFPPGTSARWDAARQRLLMRNTEENLELAKLIIEAADSK